MSTEPSSSPHVDNVDSSRDVPGSVDRPDIEHRIEEFIRRELGVNDQRLTRESELFETFVDSVGVIELLTFVEQEFAVEIPEDDLLSADFSRIDGIARIVHRLVRTRESSAHA